MIYEVAVIGGGPAGSTCARTIAEYSDKSVILFEKDEKPKPVCTGAINLAFPRFDFGVPQHLIQAKVSEALIRVGGTEARMRTKVLIVDREEFDNYLLQLAMLAGVTVQTGTKVESLRKSDGGWTLICGRERIEAEKVVFADGVLTTGSWLLPKYRDQDLATTFQVYLRIPFYIPFQIRMDFSSRWVRTGYVWEAPGFDYLKIGIYCSLADPRRDILERILKKYIKEEGYLKYGKVIRRMGKLIPSTKPIRLVYDDSIAFVGDAGRLTNPFLGGGIPHAILSGKECGRVIAKDLPLIEYERRIGWLKKYNRSMYRFRNIFNRMDDKAKSKAIRKLDGFDFTKRSIRSKLGSIVLTTPSLWSKLFGFD